MAVENVDLVKPMLDQAFTFALCWPWPTLPDSSTPITESELYSENIGDRSSYITNTCKLCTDMLSRYWLQVLLGV